MNVSRIGIDLAKATFQLHGVDPHEKVTLRRKLRRGQMLDFFRKLPPCLIGLEACGSAHHWGRELSKLGHTVKLIAPQFVKPYVKSNKNDANDAEAICEAVSRPNMRFVPIKSAEQQDIQAVHRIRSGLIRQRTAKANQIRGLLCEYGIAVPKNIEALRRAMVLLVEDTSHGLSEPFRRLLRGEWNDLQELDRRVGEMDDEIRRIALEHPIVQRLLKIPGIGPITATALIAGIGDIRLFKRGRDLSAWLGLVPKQHSTGGKDRLLGISKRGDTYLRTLLIHGARAVLRTAANKTDPRSDWLNKLAQRRNKNIAAVALANKNARIVWALLSRETNYQPA